MKNENIKIGNSKKEIGRRIKKLRQNKHLSMEELAKIINVSGKGTINNWEKGLSSPKTDNLYKLSQYFNVDENELLYGKIDDSVEFIVNYAMSLTSNDIDNIRANNELLQIDLDSFSKVIFINHLAEFHKFFSWDSFVDMKDYHEEDSSENEVHVNYKKYYADNKLKQEEYYVNETLNRVKAQNINPNDYVLIMRTLALVSEIHFENEGATNEGLISMVYNELEFIQSTKIYNLLYEVDRKTFEEKRIAVDVDVDLEKTIDNILSKAINDVEKIKEKYKY